MVTAQAIGLLLFRDLSNMPTIVEHLWQKLTPATLSNFFASPTNALFSKNVLSVIHFTEQYVNVHFGDRIVGSMKTQNENYIGNNSTSRHFRGSMARDFRLPGTVTIWKPLSLLDIRKRRNKLCLKSLVTPVLVNIVEFWRILHDKNKCTVIFYRSNSREWWSQGTRIIVFQAPCRRNSAMCLHQYGTTRTTTMKHYDFGCDKVQTLSISCTGLPIASPMISHHLSETRTLKYHCSGTLVSNIFGRPFTKFSN